MPKKTKKEKIIAELRRKLETVKTDNGVSAAYTKEPVKPQKVIQSAPQFPNYHPPAGGPITNYPPAKAPAMQNQNNIFVINDLRKTLILAALAISFEFSIYWFTELGGNRLLKFLPIFR